MDRLKLLALDQDDLKIVSAHVQDAVMKVGDLDFRKAGKRFVVPMYRFAWEKPQGFLKTPAERRNSVLDFGRVLAARRSGFSGGDPDEVLSLLSVTFLAGEAPAGTIELAFSGGAAIRLDVEVIEARLTDLGGAWEASSRPSHSV